MKPSTTLPWRSKKKVYRICKKITALKRRDKRNRLRKEKGNIRQKFKLKPNRMSHII